ncbi:MAG: carbohydrate ABC transporter permease [Saccharofermentanales bacterium]
MIENRKTRRIEKIIIYLALSLFGIIMVLPFYWSILTSLRLDADIFKIPIEWIPRRLTSEHYIKAFQTVPFLKYALNTLLITVSGMAMNLFFGAAAGYAFAKIRFVGKKIIFRMMVSSLMVPGVVTMIPTFLILKNFPLAGGNNIFGSGGFGFLNTIWGVILPGGIGVFAVFFMRQFFLSLPDDLAESARVEGAGEGTIYFKIYLPLVKPALATLGIFGFQAGWNSFLWPNIVLGDPNMKVLTMALQSFSFNNQTQYGPLMAASLFISAPVFVVFLFFQKYFVQGIALTGIKD